MRRAALIYNPTSGSRRERRLRHVTAAADVLRAAGVDAALLPTTGPAAATALARQAIADGFDTVLACGGDGTMNEVLQALVHTPTALGIIPTGTVNVLARDIGVPFTADGAARALLTAEPCRLPVGRLDYTLRNGAADVRYFTVMAGVGVDAQLPYRVDLALKKRIGIFAYVVEALRIVFRLDFAPQLITFTDAAGNPRREFASEILASRVSAFANIPHAFTFTPGASLTSPHFELLMFKSWRVGPYLRYFTAATFGRHPNMKDVERVLASEVHCVAAADADLPPAWRRRHGSPANIYAQVDGEFCGGLPVHMSVIPQAFTLLVPRGCRYLGAEPGLRGKAPAEGPA
jgi:diacylglycerol kinase (ATP)